MFSVLGSLIELEAIKSMQNKNLRYKEILATFEADEVDRELPAETLNLKPQDSADVDSSWSDCL